MQMQSYCNSHKSQAKSMSRHVYVILHFQNVRMHIRSDKMQLLNQVTVYIFANLKTIIVQSISKGFWRWHLELQGFRTLSIVRYSRN
jgi:methyl coenzyme M reductase subunit C